LFQALNALKLEHQVNLSRALMAERAQRQIAVQQAVASSRSEVKDNMDITVVSCDSWSSENGQQTSSNVVETILVTEVDSEKEKE
jgi:hypothetical protein